MDKNWLMMLLNGMGPNSAMAAGMGGGGMAGDLGMGAIPGPGVGVGGFDDTGMGAPGGTPVMGVPPEQPMQPPTAVVPVSAPATAAPTLGASLEPGAPNGAPMDIRSVDQKRMGRMGQPGATDPAQAGMAQRIQQALKGVQAPAKPDVVKPSTPGVPHAPRQIQGGDLLALINAMSNPRTPMQRPATLGGALGIGRY